MVSGAELSLVAVDCVLLLLAVVAGPLMQLHGMLFVAAMSLLFGSFCVLWVCLGMTSYLLVGEGLGWAHYR